LQAEIDGFLTSTPTPSSSQTAEFLKLYSGDARKLAAQGLVARGVPADKVSSAMNFLAASGTFTKQTLYGLLATGSAIASGYHGIKRNNGSIGYGILWFFLGGLFPVITPVVAVAQGFAKSKK
jgi:hypothetical protein